MGPRNVLALLSRASSFVDAARNTMLHPSIGWSATATRRLCLVICSVLCGYSSFFHG